MFINVRESYLFFVDKNKSTVTQKKLRELGLDSAHVRRVGRTSFLYHAETDGYCPAGHLQKVDWSQSVSSTSPKTGVELIW